MIDYKLDSSVDRQHVEALARGIRILNCFSAQRPSLTVTEIRRLTGLPQPTVFRLCHTLSKCGILRSTDASGKFSLSLQVLTFGQAALAGAGLDSLVADELNRLALKYHLAASIAVRDGNEMLIVQRAHGDGDLLLNLQLGSKLEMATSTFGVAYLCTLSAEERVLFLRQLEASHGADWRVVSENIKKLIDFYDENRYVKSFSLLKPRISSVAIPVYCDSIQCMLVLNCGGPSAAFDDKIILDDLLVDMRALGNHLSAISAISTAGNYSGRLFQR
jgi:DNA-binding IclR family transcriptional regulator